MSDIGIHLIVGLICGVIACAIASSKGRNAVGWFFGGFFLGLIGIIIVACMSNLTEQRARHAHQQRENRRLREQLAQERMKGESLRQYTTARLDAHDNHLGIDTRNAAALPGMQDNASGFLPVLTGAEPAGPQGIPVAGRAASATDVWYYLVGGEKVGPLSFDQLTMLAGQRGILGSTLVWRPGMAEWALARDTAELHPHLLG